MIANTSRDNNERAVKPDIDNVNEVEEDFFDVLMQILPNNLRAQIKKGNCINVKNWCAKYPHGAILAILGVASTLPILFILSFMLAWLIALIGFLLAIVSMFTLTCLSFVGFLLILLIVLIFGTFFGLSHLQNTYKEFISIPNTNHQQQA